MYQTNPGHVHLQKRPFGPSYAIKWGENPDARVAIWWFGARERGCFPEVDPEILEIRGDAHMDMKKYAAEAIGTFWLTFAGCGSAVIAAGFPQVGIGLLGVSLAFGLSVVTMAYAIGHISGCHLNLAVTVGLAAGGRFPAGQILPYVIAQVAGAIVGAWLPSTSSQAALPDSTSPRASRPTATTRIRPASTAWACASSPRW